MNIDAKMKLMLSWEYFLKILLGSTPSRVPPKCIAQSIHSYIQTTNIPVSIACVCEIRDKRNIQRCNRRDWAYWMHKLILPRNINLGCVLSYFYILRKYRTKMYIFLYFNSKCIMCSVGLNRSLKDNLSIKKCIKKVLILNQAITTQFL